MGSVLSQKWTDSANVVFGWEKFSFYPHFFRFKLWRFIANLKNVFLSRSEFLSAFYLPGKKGNPSQDSLPFVYSWNGNIQKAEVKPAYTISEAGFKWFAKPTVRGNLTLRELNTRAKEQNDIFHPIFVQPKALTTSRKKSSFRLLSGKKERDLDVSKMTLLRLTVWTGNFVEGKPAL